MKPIVQKQVE